MRTFNIANTYVKTLLKAVSSARNIVYSAHIDPQIFSQVRINHPYFYSSGAVPNRDDINRYRYYLIEQSKENPQMQAMHDQLSSKLLKPDCRALIVNSQYYPDNYRGDEGFSNAIQCYSALFTNLGLEMMYNDDLPVHVIVNSQNRQRLLGHQDSYTAKGEAQLQLLPYLALINSNSITDDLTWVKESSVILRQLQEQYPQSFELLKRVRFNVNIGDQKIFDQHVLFKTDSENNLYIDQFSSRARYEPDHQSLAETGYKMADADLAIYHLTQLVNQDKGKHYFCLNNQHTQFAIIDNKHVVHGRDNGRRDEDIPQHRNVAVLVGHNLQSPSIAKVNSQ